MRCIALTPNMGRMARLVLLSLVVACLALSTVAQQGDSAVASILSAANARPPVFALNFSTNPAAAIGATPAYNWSMTDPLDSSSASAYHQGVVMLNGGASSYVDLTTATGANSAGAAMPYIGGAGSNAFGTAGQGWSFECVFKFPSGTPSGWPKVFFLGNGGGVDDIVLTWDGNNNGRLALQMYNNNTAFPQFNYALKDAFNPVANQWYHLVWEIQAVNVSAGIGNWFLWVNGQQVNNSGGIVPGTIFTWLQGALTPSYAPRSQSYLGKSDFNDADAVVTIDSFRVYDYALPGSLVQQLASAYNLNIPTTQNSSYPFPASSEDMMAAVAVPRPALFSATFPSNPASVVGGSLNYVWAQSDPSDSSTVAALHQGVVILNGTASSFVNLQTTYGPNSAGLLLPVFGGAGSGVFGSTQGQTFEMVFKLMTPPQNWCKLFNLGDGGGVNTAGWTWNGNNVGTVEVQNYDNFGGSPTINGFSTETELTILNKPVQNGTWMHVAHVMLNTDPSTYATANWTVYVNGVAVNNYTNGNQPLAVYRPFSYLAGSDWTDLPAPMVIDAFRIYDYALTQSQVQAVAAVYGLNNGPAVQPTLKSSSSSSAAPSAGSSSSSVAPSSVVAPSSAAQSSVARASSSSTAAPTTSPTSASYVTSSPTTPPSYVTSITSTPVVASSSSAVVNPPSTVNSAASTLPTLLSAVLLALTIAALMA